MSENTLAATQLMMIFMDRNSVVVGELIEQNENRVKLKSPIRLELLSAGDGRRLMLNIPKEMEDGEIIQMVLPFHNLMGKSGYSVDMNISNYTTSMDVPQNIFQTYMETTTGIKLASQAEIKAIENNSKKGLHRVK